MRTLVLFHCRLKFRQSVPLVLSVLSLVLVWSRETWAGSSSFNGISIGGSGAGPGGTSPTSRGGDAGDGDTTLSGGAHSSSFSGSSSYGDYASNNHTDKPLLNPKEYQIGGVLSNEKSINSFSETISVSMTKNTHTLIFHDEFILWYNSD